MKRVVLFVLILLDLAFVAAVALRLKQRYTELKSPPAVEAAPPADAAAIPAVDVSTAPAVIDGAALSSATVAGVAASTAPVEVAASTAATAAEVSASTTTGVPTSFRYRNTAAKKVSLSGAFNGWTPEPFRKSAAGLWTLKRDIPPGEYPYQLIVDGRAVRDPNQRRSDEKGRSLLRVAAPAPK